MPVAADGSLSLPAGRSRCGRDRGAASLLVLGLVAVAALLLVAVGALVGAESARRHAQVAADQAALAAGTAIRDGVHDPCERGRQAAERNGGRLVSCLITGSVAAVEVERTSPVPGSVASARARAGPAWARLSAAG